MSLEATKRKYSMSDADLIQRGEALFNSITRDQALFANRGLSAGNLSDFKDLCDAFSDSDTDEELSGQLSVAAQDKDAKRHQLEVQIRQVRSMADIKYSGDGLYKTFGFDDLTRQKDSDLVRQAKRIHRVATTLKTDLMTQGLNDAFLTTLAGYNTSFDNAIDAVESVKELRDMRTQQRITTGNQLFDEMMRLAAIGRSIYEDLDEAKYNDYVIDDHVNAPQDQPPTP